MRVKPSALTVAIQCYHMRCFWPQFASKTNRGNYACWTGKLQPTHLSETFQVEIAYTAPWRPKVCVLSPELKVHPEHTRLPHVFSDGTLCVHTDKDWRPGLVIARTILPWTCAWLYFYELWLLTGCWLGGGTHPEFPQHRSPYPVLAA